MINVRSFMRNFYGIQYVMFNVLQTLIQYIPSSASLELKKLEEDLEIRVLLYCNSLKLLYDNIIIIII